MRKAWEQIDLDGGGLQAVNVRLRHAMRKRPVAYALWFLFPVGAHRFYLGEHRGGLVYLALSACCAVVGLTLGPPYVWVCVGILLALSLFDLWWIDGAVTRLNKALRMATLLQRDRKPPSGYQGRFGDDNAPPDPLTDYIHLKERERAGHPTAGEAPAANDGAASRRVPTLAEQEAMLKELARRRGRRDEP